MNNTTRQKIERKSINIISKIIDELPQVLTNFELLNEENNNLANLLCGYNKLKSDYGNLETKYNNLLVKIEKFEEIYSTIPGTTREDKNRYLEFLALRVLPEIIKEAKSSTYKIVERHWGLYHNSIYKEIIPKVKKHTFVVSVSLYVFYTLCYDTEIVNDDNILELINECFIINIGNDTYNISTEKILKHNIVVNYANKIHSQEMIMEIIDIANYYLDIYNNKGEKEKNPCEIIELYEYNELMYKTLEKIQTKK